MLSLIFRAHNLFVTLNFHECFQIMKNVNNWCHKKFLQYGIPKYHPVQGSTSCANVLNKEIRMGRLTKVKLDVRDRICPGVR